MLSDRVLEAVRALSTLVQKTPAFYVVLPILISSLILFLNSRSTKPRLLKDVYIAGLDGGRRTLPQARQHFVQHCTDMMVEGYQKTNAGFYYIPSPAGERLMIPTRYIEELKNSPDESVDFTGSFLEMFMGDYTTIGRKWHLHPAVVKRDLNSHLAEITPFVQDEIYHAYEILMPACKTWTKVDMPEMFTEIISRASNRMMGGKPLSRNSEWTRTSIDFTADSSLAAMQLKQYYPSLRPLAQYWIPEMTKVRQHGEISRRTIVPLIKSRLEEQMQLKDEYKPPIDLLQMLWDTAHGPDKTPDFMAYTALAISFAAVRTSSSVPTHILYDLCARREYIAPLREEIQTVLAEEGGCTKQALNRLIKLDSFMKESEGLTPSPFVITFGRLIHHDLTLKDGVVIPAGTLIAVPTNAVMRDQRFFPGEFDGFRFANRSDSNETATQPSFVTTNQSNLSWGYGKHACSGRFFASNEIKMILAYFLLHYDFKFGGERTERPKNLDFELQSVADPSVEILIKRRKEVHRP